MLQLPPLGRSVWRRAGLPFASTKSAPRDLPARSSAPTGTLAILTALHALAAVFFVSDVVADLLYEGGSFHNLLEAVVSGCLVAGVMLGAVEIRRMLVRARRTEAALSVARGALGALIEDRFKTWRLTPAEVDVALLALKGFDVARIAELRGAAAGTVRAQLARIYGKAGVSSHVELLSTFIEDLLGSPIALPRALPGESTMTAAAAAADAVPRATRDRVSAEGPT